MEKMTCKRCKGKGLINSHVVYAGIPGGCFSCSATGEVYKDPFYRNVGYSEKYFGITCIRYYNENNPNNGVYKQLCGDIKEMEEIKKFAGKNYRIVEISEEQARKTWKVLNTLLPVKVRSTTKEEYDSVMK